MKIQIAQFAIPLLAGLATAAPASLPASIDPPSTQTPYKQPQIAIHSGRVGLTWGSGNTIYFAQSVDGGRTFAAPVTVASTGFLSLGNHRGPRLVMTSSAILITAIYGEKGKGADGDLLAYRSTDGGRTWSKPARVNDQGASAREGLHGIAADGDFIYAAWLDDRAGGKELYGAASTDGGATWAPNQRIYHSADGHICECCHPSVAVRGREVYAMFRNWLDGSRDLYLASSSDGGRTFDARKLGEDTWKLNACPMDGGGLVLDEKGPLTVWRRGSTVFLDRPGAKETELGPGKNPTIVGHTVIWSTPTGLRMNNGHGESLLDVTGAFPAAASENSREIAAWESNGKIVIKILSDQ